MEVLEKHFQRKIQEKKLKHPVPVVKTFQKVLSELSQKQKPSSFAFILVVILLMENWEKK